MNTDFNAFGWLDWEMNSGLPIQLQALYSPSTKQRSTVVLSIHKFVSINKVSESPEFRVYLQRILSEGDKFAPTLKRCICTILTILKKYNLNFCKRHTVSMHYTSEKKRHIFMGRGRAHFQCEDTKFWRGAPSFDRDMPDFNKRTPNFYWARKARYWWIDV